MDKLNSLLSVIKKYIKNDASTPKMVDRFWSNCIQTKYPSLNQIIEISFSWGVFEIVKKENGYTVFKCQIKHIENSNMSELLAKDIYEQIYVKDSSN